MRIGASVRTSLVVFAAAFSCALSATSDLLIDSKGNPILTEADWKGRRGELLQEVMTYVYGHVPEEPATATVKIRSTRPAVGGKAIETLGTLTLSRNHRDVSVRFGLIRPVGDTRVPVILHNDRWRFDLDDIPDSEIREVYRRSGRKDTFENLLPKIIDRGFALCKFIRDDVAADEMNARETGVLALYPEYDWGTIAAWGWFYRPLIDYLAAQRSIHPDRIIATGHSRGGKAALAAAILDERISIAAPSASGSGGTGSWRHFTEGGDRQTPEHFASARPYWFSQRFTELSKPEAPPLDGHTLLALVAPRGIVNTQGRGDSLANPRGTKLMFDAVEPVYRLLGVPGRIATRWRDGGHGQELEDWEALLDYSDALFDGKPIPAGFNNWPAQTD